MTLFFAMGPLLTRQAQAQFPNYPLQSRINSCGAAALAAVLTHLGWSSMRESTLLKWADADYAARAKAVPVRGLSFGDLRRLGERAGAVVTPLRLPLSAFAHLPVPVILYVSHQDRPHYLVVWGAQGQQVQVFDPAVGQRWLDLETLAGLVAPTGDSAQVLVFRRPDALSRGRRLSH